MRWKIKLNQDKDGDIRRKARFAFLPTVVEDHWVWLEYYISIEQMKVLTGFDEIGSTYTRTEWVQIDRELTVYYP